jgi:hypothetical protein
VNEKFQAIRKTITSQAKHNSELGKEPVETGISYDRIKKLNSFQKKLEYENKMISGYKLEKIEEERPIRKQTKAYLKTSGELYIKDIELLKKGIELLNLVNPIAFEVRRRNEEFDLQRLEKKKRSHSLRQKNLGF